MNEKRESWEMAETERGQPLPARASRKSPRLRYVVLGLLVAACGGSLGKSTAGGESHFLEVCAETCSSGLECIASVCTRRCTLESADCTDLSPDAACINHSTGPGMAAVCDVECARDRDCTGLGEDFQCSAGFCRTTDVSEPPPKPGGSGGAPAFEPFSDEHCESRNVTSECSFEATCNELRCGDGFSQFGADGCTRYCESDTDCGAGERCRHTALAITDNECPSIGSEVEGCTMVDGECSCSVTSDCRYPNICVDAQDYPESDDCEVTGATCRQLSTARERVATFTAVDDGSEASVKAAQCLGEIDGRRLELACASEPNEAFAPACEVPLDFESSCGFAATCEALGCGDGLSQFDARGCTRYCETAADCGQGERCRRTRLFLSEEECPSPGSEVEGCSFVDSACQCITTTDCDHPDVCVDATIYPESLDCAVEGASCQVLAIGEFRLEEFLLTEATTDAAAEARSCLDAIRAQQEALACSE